MNIQKKLYITIFSIFILCSFLQIYQIYRAHPKLINQKIEKTVNTPKVNKAEIKTITLNFVGDILAARAIELTMRKKGYDYPFEKIKDILADADITFANLETPLIGTATSGKTTVGGTTVFRGDIEFAKALKNAGIDMVSLANNHIKDQGEKGIVSTMKVLDGAGVSHVGAGKNIDEAKKLVIIEKKGLKIGYLAYNDADVVPEYYHAKTEQSGSNIMSIEGLKRDVFDARPQVDILIISMHSGTEYITKNPNQKQIDFAHAAIDAGADMIIGHHPHVLQPMEIYKGKYIFYSLGNFIFDQPWPDTKESALLGVKISFEKNENDIPDTSDKKVKIINITPQITPLIIQNFQPQETENLDNKKRIIERFAKQTHVFSFEGKALFVEVATTTEARTKGLSDRQILNQDTGLLFVFDGPGKHGIWMKDMLFPIDIYWFDKDFKLVDIRQSIATSTFPDVFYPKVDALYVLETHEGVMGDMSLTNNSDTIQKDLTGELTLLQSYDKR